MKANSCIKETGYFDSYFAKFYPEDQNKQWKFWILTDFCCHSTYYL